jgi:hypothetical protein
MLLDINNFLGRVFSIGIYKISYDPWAMLW